MDKLPYQFVDSVFAGLSRETINNVHLQSVEWADAARVYKEKLREVICSIFSTDDGLTYRIECTRPDYHGSESITLDQLDPRYHRVIVFNADSETNAGFKPFDMANLSQMITYISHFQLDNLNIDGVEEFVNEGDPQWVDFLKKLMEELGKHELRAKCLDMGFAPESVAFLRKELKNPHVEHVILTGEWETVLKAADFKEIIACWASQIERKHTTINMETEENIEEEFEAWMVPEEGTGYQKNFSLHREDFIVHVKCDAQSCTITFTRN